MNNNIIRIVAAIVDTRQLTLYKENGETVIINQGDPRLRKIVEDATPQLTSQGWADVDVKPMSDDTYATFEAQTNGMVKLYRVAKDKLKQLLGLGVVEEEPFGDAEKVTPVALGKVPSDTPATDHINSAGIYDVSEADEVAAAAEEAGERTVKSVVDEIIAHAVPVASEGFSEDGVAKQGNVVEESGHTDSQKNENADSPNTMIAVVDGKVIPGMERIKTQFGYAVKNSSPMGLQRFLERLGTVIQQRSHSVEDLLKFMERADMPIADDGSIIIYKVLKKHSNSDRDEDRVYVDCHTSKVKQWIGAYVCMDTKLVDHNRNNECSNGLHVARRGYIREFSGNVCVLAKLAPEDVITVPKYDANKMRVCGYHIIAELSAEEYALVKQNKPITEIKSGQVKLSMAIAGKHIRKTDEVKITQQKGGGVVVTKLGKDTAPAPVDDVKPIEALTNPEHEKKDLPIDPKAVAEKVETVKLSRAEQAKALYEDWATAPDVDKADRLDALKAFKKQAKVGWDKLGIPTKDGEPVLPKSKKVKPAPEAIKQAVGAFNGEGSPRERIHKLLTLGLDKTVAQKIVDIKKQAKKSWDALGIPQVTVDNIYKKLG